MYKRQVDTRTASVQFTDKDGINLGEATPYEPDDVNKALPTAEAPAGKSFIGWKFAGVDGTYKTLTDALLTKLAETGNTVAATPVFHTPSSGIGGGSGNSRYAVTVDGDIENGSVTVSDTVSYTHLRENWRMSRCSALRAKPRRWSCR